nr:transposase [Mycobacterium avium]
MYRASGLSPMQYESAGKPRDGKIRREGSVALRRALTACTPWRCGARICQSVPKW